jgi:hypothetical protein
VRWLRKRREREWQRIYNGHYMYVSRQEPNRPVELTCFWCGYTTENLDPMFTEPPYVPMPINEPCPGRST